MERYANLSGTSGVVAYLCGTDFIAVEFDKGRERVYLYTHASAGPAVIAEMQRLARGGIGLNSYIMRVARRLYAAKGLTLGSLGIS